MELVVFVALAFIALLDLIALVDALRRPAWQWQQAGRSRSLWLIALVAGLFLPGLGIVIALGYFFFPQPALRRAGPPVGAPGGGYGNH